MRPARSAARALFAGRHLRSAASLGRAPSGRLDGAPCSMAAAGGAPLPVPAEEGPKSGE